MHEVLLLATLIVCATAQEDQCNGNIVQALQKCASSITANEPLEVQQQKCSPPACNYDCPSSNKLDSIDTQVAGITSAIQGLSATQQALVTTVENNTARLNSTGVTQQALAATVENNTARLDSTDIAQQALAATVEDNTARLDSTQVVCGSTGWTRVAYLDMSDIAEECPQEFRLYQSNGIRACGRQATDIATCDSITLATDGQTYQMVCGRVIGYQFGSTNAIHNDGAGHNDIDSAYLDGVSLTYGSLPRKHVWSFLAGFQEVAAGELNCPCNIGSDVVVQSFIGDDYYCEAGNPEVSWSAILYADPLWNGKGCRGIEGGCCSVPDIPWFQKVLDTPTTEDLELRICGDQGTGNEDNPVGLYEIYIK